MRQCPPPVASAGAGVTQSQSAAPIDDSLQADVLSGIGDKISSSGYRYVASDARKFGIVIIVLTVPMYWVFCSLIATIPVLNILFQIILWALGIIGLVMAIVPSRFNKLVIPYLHSNDELIAKFESGAFDHYLAAKGASRADAVEALKTYKVKGAMKAIEEAEKKVQKANFDMAINTATSTAKGVTKGVTGMAKDTVNTVKNMDSRQVASVVADVLTNPEGVQQQMGEALGKKLYSAMPSDFRQKLGEEIAKRSK